MGIDILSLILSIVAAVLLVVGFLGSFLPVIPGPPLAWAGLLAAYFSSYNLISLNLLIITAIVAVVVTILDNILPPLMTKKTGGSKWATWGSTIGLIIGLFMGPVGIIAGPFIGAFVGEIIHSKGDAGLSFKSAWGSFMGFLFGTGIKMIVVGIYIWFYVKSF
ncbi:MAG: DUF456 domain-containing protein [Treponema sp.]|nr:DUF456 domain-containing protein [Treponema sp.]